MLIKKSGGKQFSFRKPCYVLILPYQKRRVSMETSLLIERKSTTVNSPFVSVPVLSNATTFIPAKFSRTSPPLMRNPVLAAFSNAQNVATGVDSTNAHGHALTNRTRANFNHFLGFLALITKGTTANPAAISTTPAIVICIASSFDLLLFTYFSF